VATFVVRLWVPDRPGALGAVASRIGAVRGDLIGIDILERGAGRAIDELVVELPSGDLVDLLVAEVGQVDGVDVEDVRPATEAAHDPRLDALETAAVLVDQPSLPALHEALATNACSDFEAEWAVVVDLGPPAALAGCGEAPAVPWLSAFVQGRRSSAGPDGSPDDVAWAELAGRGMADGDAAVVLGRRGRPFRARERRQLDALARIAGRRAAELGRAPGPQPVGARRGRWAGPGAN